MNILLRIILLIFLAFAGHSYATTAVSYGYGVNAFQVGAEKLNNDALTNSSDCCSNSSTRDSKNPAQAGSFFVSFVDFVVTKGEVPVQCEGSNSKLRLNMELLPEIHRKAWQVVVQQTDNMRLIIPSRLKAHLPEGLELTRQMEKLLYLTEPQMVFFMVTSDHLRT